MPVSQFPGEPERAGEARRADSASILVSLYRDYKNRDGQSWDRQFGNYCEFFFTVTAIIVSSFMAQKYKGQSFQ